MNATRLYRIEHRDTIRLVRATNRNQAIWHVAQEVFKTRVATQDDVLVYAKAGLDVIDATKAQQELPAE
jgi:hypothetical protein